MKILVFIWCLLLPLSTGISAQTADSTGMSPGKPAAQALEVFLAPTLLVGAGIATMEDRFWYSSYDAYDCIQRNFPDSHSKLDNVLLFLPAASVYGLNLAGVKGKNNFADRSVAFLISLSLAGLSGSIIKSHTDIMRPDGSDDRSFPSTHTALAFVSATFLHEEYKDLSIWYSIAGYSLATATGVLRMTNNKHWMSDVFVGAGLGILSAKLVYWVYPVIKDRLGNRSARRDIGNLSILPYVARDHYGVFLQYRIR